MDTSTNTETPAGSSQGATSKPREESKPTTPDISDLFKVYKPPAESEIPQSLAELNDSDFEPTSAELQAAYAGQKQRLDALVNAPLKTQAIKEREQKAKIGRWPKVCGVIDTSKLTLSYSQQLVKDDDQDKVPKSIDIGAYL